MNCKDETDGKLNSGREVTDMLCRFLSEETRRNAVATNVNLMKHLP